MRFPFQLVAPIGLPAGAFLLALLCPGCVSGFSSRDNGGYSQLVYEMVRDQPHLEPAGALRTPIRLGVAQLGEVAPSTKVLGELCRHPDLIAAAIALPMPAESRERFLPRGPNPAEPRVAGNRLADLRSLGRALGAEQVLVFGGGTETWCTRNVLAPLDATLIGMTVFPSARLHGRGKAAGLLLDVESGAVRFQVQTERQRRGLSPSAFTETQLDSLQVRLRDDLASHLAEEFVQRLRAP